MSKKARKIKPNSFGKSKNKILEQQMAVIAGGQGSSSGTMPPVPFFNPDSNLTKWQSQLRNLFQNRFHYSCENEELLSDDELHLLEDLLFTNGQAVIFRPKIERNNMVMNLPYLLVSSFSIVEFNRRNNVPFSINLTSNIANHNISRVYDLRKEDEFVIISNDYSYLQANLITPQLFAWEFANRLNNCNVGENASQQRNQLGLVMRGAKAEHKNNFLLLGQALLDRISTIFVPDDITSQKNLNGNVLENIERDTNFLVEISAEKEILDEFMRQLGFHRQERLNATYQTDTTQEESSHSSEFFIDSLMRNRLRGVKKANKMWEGLNLKLRLVE